MIDPNQVKRAPVHAVRLAIVEILVLVALALAPALPSWADGDEEAAAEPVAEAASGPEYVPCSELSRLKYPFLRCVRGPSGRPVLANEGPGVAGAQLKFRGSFASGAGAWGSTGIE